MLKRSPERLAAAAAQKMGKDVHLFVIAHSGHGRMPVRKVKGRGYATVWTECVRLPDGMRTIKGPDKYDFSRSVTLGDIEAFVKKQTSATVAKK